MGWGIASTYPLPDQPESFSRAARLGENSFSWSSHNASPILSVEMILPWINGDESPGSVSSVKFACLRAQVGTTTRDRFKCISAALHAF